MVINRRNGACSDMENRQRKYNQKKSFKYWKKHLWSAYDSPCLQMLVEAEVLHSLYSCLYTESITVNFYPLLELLYFSLATFAWQRISALALCREQQKAA